MQETYLKDFCKKCDCNEKNFIVNKTHYLCERKNKERLDIQKEPGYKNKKLDSFLYTAIKQKENVLKLKEIYDEIACERERICSSCGTSKMLTHSHIIPRSRRKDLETNKNNIMYQCLTCHNIWEHGTIAEKMDLNNFKEIMNYIKETDCKYYNLITQKWQE